MRKSLAIILAAVTALLPLAGSAFAAHTHEYQAEIHLPTCTEEGYTRYVCSCGDSYIDNVYPARGHKWDDGVVTRTATCGADGVRTYTCQRKNCGETRTEAIPATGEHIFVDGFCSVCGQEGPCPSTAFTDVSRHDDAAHPDHVYHAAIDWAVRRNITNGTSETTFSPHAGCTRAQAVTFLWRAAGCPKPSSADNPFTDLEPGAYYVDAVLWASEQEITNGTTATTFSPESTCTRAQIVTFLYRALRGVPIAGGTFVDVPAGEWFSDAVGWAVAQGITNGVDAEHFAPDAVCERAHIVTFLWRTAKKTA